MILKALKDVERIPQGFHCSPSRESAAYILDMDRNRKPSGSELDLSVPDSTYILRFTIYTLINTHLYAKRRCLCHHKYSLLTMGLVEIEPPPLTLLV